MLLTKVQIGSNTRDIINALVDADVRFSEVPKELQNAWKEDSLDDIRDEEAEVYKYYDSCPDF